MKRRERLLLASGKWTYKTSIPGYKSWYTMMARCYSATATNYSRYGGKGITVCARWHDFENFHTDMGDRTAGTTLDRINNARNYEPGNCRWANVNQQQNNKSSTALIEYHGLIQSKAEWAQFLGIPTHTLYTRLHRGWNLDKALTKEMA